MRSSIQSSDVTIVLTHVPNTDVLSISSIPPSKTIPINVLLCGHFLNGLLRLPFIGPVFVPSEFLPMYGLFPGYHFLDLPLQIQKTYIIPSAGLGAHDSMYPFFFLRLFNPPTVDIITLSTSSI